MARIHIFSLLLLVSPLTVWAQPDVAAIVQRIEQQYDAIDTVMLSRPYVTRSEVQRRGDAPRLEHTHFAPNRPKGERERLVSVDGQDPTASDVRRFNRRPQPDDRDSQPIRLTIPYDALELTGWEGEQVTFRFTPVLHLDDNISEFGDLFRGELVWDQSQQKIREVRMWLTESFRYSIFQIHRFTVDETFKWVDDVLMRAQYHHDIELRNFWLDLSNRITMDFDYSSQP